MPTLQEHFPTLRGRVEAGRYSGPDLLIEGARGSAEILLPRPRVDARTLRQTMPISTVSLSRRERTEPMLALIDLVADTSSVFELRRDKTPLRVGRDPGNDIVISDATISALHVELRVDGGSVEVSDQGSSNGTFVNQVRLSPQQPQRLAAGDCLRLGQRVFYYLNGARVALFVELWGAA